MHHSLVAVDNTQNAQNVAGKWLTRADAQAQRIWNPEMMKWEMAWQKAMAMFFSRRFYQEEEEADVRTIHRQTDQFR